MNFPMLATRGDSTPLFVGGIAQNPTPYGWSPPGPAHSGLAGQWREAAGMMLLGAGHRSYCPTMMRFMQSDVLSPFDAGGLNTYSYCKGDPINRVDPMGSFSMKLGIYLGSAFFTGSSAVFFAIDAIELENPIDKAAAAGAAVASAVLATGLSILAFKQVRVMRGGRTASPLDAPSNDVELQTITTATTAASDLPFLIHRAPRIIDLRGPQVLPNSRDIGFARRTFHSSSVREQPPRYEDLDFNT